MSCCDINSCYEFFSDDVCDTLISEWGCTVIRLPVTVRSLDNGYIHFPEYYYDEVCEYADALIAHGVYVIINWYNYFDGDPNEYADEAEALHFYAGSHGQALRDKVQTALDNGLPVFCTQWGVSLDTGDSGVFYDESREWIDYLNANNISWCNWSIGSRHTESSNVLRLYSDRFTIEQKLAGHWPDEMLSESGIFVRALIRGEDNG